MKMNYENELMQLKENFNRDLSELKNNLDKSPGVGKKNNIIKNKNKELNEKQKYYLEKMSLLIDESYEKYKQEYHNINNHKSIACKDGIYDHDIMKLEFIKNVLDDFFSHNKNNELKSTHKDNNRINNISYDDNNMIYNNELMREIFSFLPEIQKENNIFHKNFNDLMNYISTNVEGKVI
jgi:hypothetical protein